MQIFPLQDALAQLGREKTEFLRLLRGSQFDISLYKPDRIDRQTPHQRDEAYLVATGSGRFECGDTVKPVVPGDLLFVEAGAAHRFIDFSDDFSTWVIFFGAAPSARPT
jgi:mannose-6-phosphate isomerase-like protein (cupin superfamily)